MNNASVLALGVGLAVGNEALTLNNTNATGSVRCDQGRPRVHLVGPITLGVDASINVQTNAAFTISGTVSGAGGLTKFGPGVLTLASSGRDPTAAPLT